MNQTNQRLFSLFAFLILGQCVYGQAIPESFFSAMGVRNIGPGTMSGRVTAIGVAENHSPRTIYLGTASGGLWKSTNDGTTWQPIFDTLSAHSIGSISVHPRYPDVIWVGTGEGNPRNSQTQGRGVFRSMDGGRSWQCMGLEGTRTIHRIILDPDDVNTVYVGATGTAWGETQDRGVYKTTDGGKTWEKVLYVDPRTGVADMVMDPTNPNKLIVAMWEYRRWPWFFKSGGEGSGMYLTTDAGKTWKKLTDEDGLPAGELGRVGLAISASNPNVVYALVEAKKNGLYRSDDGGFSWKLVQGKNIGGRPFYYAEIYVDPANENHLFNIHTFVEHSIDGGKTFEQLMPAYGTPNGVHPDNHAWYVSPNDPNFIIDGNDGGAAISRDGGKTWRFIENLPVGQFYHIAVDKQVPYNIYGGLQDNGSYVGPSRAYNWGGIRNSDFQEIFFGDGFDVLPDPSDPAFAYAMSQGGNVGRVHLQSGGGTFVKPEHPEGIKLRFNWNAGIAADPFNPRGVYFGSQFLHHSNDNGASWQVISPDLTTNDSTKQKAGESGGLTYDATNAENHTTILTIAPSPLDKNVVWVGTDDGNVQLTRDGGKTWTNLASKLTGVPSGSWVPQITASSHNAGEAYVIVNDYRRDNWTPWLFRTRDFGATWENLVSSKTVDGYTLSFIQDSKAPNLYFLGTEFGLYVSVDAGKTWTRWPHKQYPTCSTYDMALQQEESDLVIGSFGRGIWVIDDIQPLRSLAQNTALLEKTVAAFPVSTTYLYEERTPKGTRFAAHAIYQAENEKPGVPLSFFVKQGKEEKKAAAPVGAKPAPEAAPAKDKKKKGDEQPTTTTDSTKKEMLSDTATVEILNSAGEVVRTRRMVATTGLNRWYWEADMKGVRFPGRPKPKPDAEEQGGMPAPLGMYTARISYRGDTVATPAFEITLEPNLGYMKSSYNQGVQKMQAFNDEVALTTALVDRLDDAKGSIERLMGLLTDQQKKDSTYKPLLDLAKAYKDSVSTLRGLIIFDDSEVKGIYDGPDVLRNKIFAARQYMGNFFSGPSGNADIVVGQAEAELRKVRARVEKFLQEEWPKLQQAAQAVQLTPFWPLTELPD